MKRHSPILIYVVCVMISFVCACNKRGGLPKDPSSKKTDAIDLLSGSENPAFILDKEKLSQLVKSIENGKFGNIHSLVVIHNDDLVLEKYFKGWNRDMLHPCNSVTKSFTSALIGIAFEQGKIGSINDKIIELLPEYKDVIQDDERKKIISLKHVLNMTAGFVWNEFFVPVEIEDGVVNPDNDVIKMHYNDDWVKYIMERPLQHDPGKVFTYNSGCTILLSKILTVKTGKTAEDFARENLFHPLGITDWKWKRPEKWTYLPEPAGLTNTVGTLQMRPVDMAMFGYLFLNKGRLNDTQIIPDWWIAESTAKQTDIGFGYHWVNDADTLSMYLPDIDGIDMYYAKGYQGQYIIVIPHLNMVIVSTAKNPGQGIEGKDIVFKGILPALKKVRG